jgi:hypothetical protein
VRMLFLIAHGLHVHPRELLEAPTKRMPRRPGRPRKTSF